MWGWRDIELWMFQVKSVQIQCSVISIVQHCPNGIMHRGVFNSARHCKRLDVYFIALLSLVTLDNFNTPTLNRLTKTVLQNFIINIYTFLYTINDILRILCVYIINMIIEYLQHKTIYLTFLQSSWMMYRYTKSEKIHIA